MDTLKNGLCSRITYLKEGSSVLHQSLIRIRLVFTIRDVNIELLGLKISYDRISDKTSHWFVWNINEGRNCPYPSNKTMANILRKSFIFLKLFQEHTAKTEQRK